MTANNIGYHIHAGKAQARRALQDTRYPAPVRTTTARPLKPMPLFERVCFRIRGSWFVTYGRCELSDRYRFWVRSRFADPVADFETLDAAIGDVFTRVLSEPLAFPTPF